MVDSQVDIIQFNQPIICRINNTFCINRTLIDQWIRRMNVTRIYGANGLIVSIVAAERGCEEKNSLRK